MKYNLILILFLFFCYLFNLSVTITIFYIMIEHHCSILDLLLCWPYSCFHYDTSFKLLKLEVEISFLVSLLVFPYFSHLYWSYISQAFINYNFSCTRFCACKTLLGGAHPCTWEIVYVKEQMCKWLIITWRRGRNSTKLVFEPLAAKNGCFISILCTISIYMMISFIFAASTLSTWSILQSSTTIFDKLKWEQFSKSNILIMDHEHVLENSSFLHTACRMTLSVWRLRQIS